MLMNTNEGSMAEKPGAILVVDDAPDMRALLCDELSERGYRVAAAASQPLCDLSLRPCREKRLPPP